METVHSLIGYQARKQGSRIAFTFLGSSDNDRQSLTFADLARVVDDAAAGILRHSNPGDRVILLYEAGLQFIVSLFGCMRAGVIPVPLYPPDIQRLVPSFAHLGRVVADSGATVVLCSRAVLDTVRPLLSDGGLPGLKWLSSLEGGTGPRTIPLASVNEVAMLQYTSGSTGAPKGVCLSHGNLLANQRSICDSFGLEEGAIVASWLPLYHDMGLIGAVLQPLWLGGHLVFMAPRSFISRPIRWLRIVSEYGVTISGGPDFAYDVCAKRASAAPEDLDLSSWRVAFNGSEPIRAASLTRFTNAFSKFGLSPLTIRPCYGLAESSLLVTGSRPLELPKQLRIAAGAFASGRVQESEKDTTLRVISSGVPPAGVRVEVVNYGELQPDNSVGEVWVQGDSVAQGYWNNPIGTAVTFKGVISGVGGFWLKTGDLGFKRQGELFVTGRIKDLIIIRGRKYHAEDIEASLKILDEEFPGRGACCAIQDGDGRVCLIQELRSNRVDPNDFALRVRAVVYSSLGLTVDRVGICPPRSIPRTPNGKIQRAKSSDLFHQGVMEVSTDVNFSAG